MTTGGGGSYSAGASAASGSAARASSGRDTGWARLCGVAGPTVALTHAPDVWDAMDGAPTLTLAGHTHGGQIAPWPLGATRLPDLGRKYVSGWYERPGARLYVTRGVGTSGPPLRIGAPPEIVVIELRPG